MGDDGAPLVSKRSYWLSRKATQERDAVGTKFTLREVKDHLRRVFPYCPEAVRHELYRRLRSRRWDIPLSRAVGIAVDTFVRHELTDYEKLYQSGIYSRDRARQLVRAEVRDIIQSWGPQQENTIRVLDDI